MTVHLISVGLSVLDALADPYTKLAADEDAISAIGRERPHRLLEEEGIGDDERDAAGDWLAAALAAEGAPGRNLAHARRLREVSAAVRPDRWPPGMSAEIDTFGRDRRAGIPLRASDIAILICSDTPRGLLAGVWNALALTDAGFSRVRYVPEPGPSAGELRGHALVVRVPGMDAGDEAGFRQAMRGLGLLARYVFQSGQLAKGEEFRFYLSGGFKAAIPYLIGLAEAVRSIDRERLRQLGAEKLMPDDGRYPVQAFVLHDTAGPRASPIRLPLRRLDAEAVRYELSGFNRDGFRHGKPDGALLNGYAYEAEGRPGRESCKLTAFGAGLRALFGVPAGVPGG
jgi:hypothetical protein